MPPNIIELSKDDDLSSSSDNFELESVHEYKKKNVVKDDLSISTDNFELESVLVHKKKRCVSFGMVEIREYQRIQGDECLCEETGNPQMLLDWEFEVLLCDEVDDFESSRSNDSCRRKRDELWLSVWERKFVLGMLQKKKKSSLVGRFIKKCKQGCNKTSK